jgi:hypothetical protein
VQRPIAFGRKVFLAESARDLIAQHDVWDGNPVDEQHVVVSLKRHKPTIGDVPQKVRRLSFQPQPDRVQLLSCFVETPSVHDVRRTNRDRASSAGYVNDATSLTSKLRNGQT